MKNITNSVIAQTTFSTLKVFTISVILGLSGISLASGAYNPFIYFRF